MSELFMEAGVIALSAFISPICADDERVGGMAEHGDFIEKFCDDPIGVCEGRDLIQESPRREDQRLNCHLIAL